MDDARPTAAAVAIRGHQIVAVGSAEELAGMANPGTRVVDLAGLTVLPGFNDCHMHIMGLGIALLGAPVSPDAGVRDSAALIAALRTWGLANPLATWVRGYGYNQNAFPGVKHVELAQMDRAFPDRPVIVFHASGHAAVANTVALRQAGIDAGTDDPDGGSIVRDQQGEATGLLLEAAIGLVTRVMPPYSRSERADAVERACAQLITHGITSASDMGIGGVDLDGDIRAYRDAVDRGAPVRMTLCPETADLWSPDTIPERASFAADWCLERTGQTPRPGVAGSPGSLRLGALKLYADGALTTRTAALSAPYVDGSGSGMLLHAPEQLRAYILSGHRRGWQIATHAIGDRAVAEVLSGYETAAREGADRRANAETEPDRRHRIEHAMLLSGDLIARIRRAGVVAVLQPEFVARLGDAYVLGLGAARAALLNPVRSLLDEGVTVAFSSDCPVVPGAPLDGIRAATERRSPSGRVLGEDQRCTALESVRAYTAGAAIATRDGAHVGRIAPGHRADLVFLSAFPGASPVAAEVKATMVGGAFVYGEGGLA